MPRHFHSALVCFFYCGAQFVARYVHIRFERSRALIGPEVHHASRVFRPGQFVHHRRERAAAFQIRRRDVHLRSNHSAAVDKPLDFQIRVRRYAASRANRGDAEREIEAWEAGAHVRIHRRRAAHRKEHVVMHAD